MKSRRVNTFRTATNNEVCTQFVGKENEKIRLGGTR
jgi:hypothetical protein